MVNVETWPLGFGGIETWEIHLVCNIWRTFTVAPTGACTRAIITETAAILRIAVAVWSTTATSTTSATTSAATADVSTSTTRVVSKADVNIQQVFLLSVTFIIFLQRKAASFKTSSIEQHSLQCYHTNNAYWHEYYLFHFSVDIFTLSHCCSPLYRSDHCLSLVLLSATNFSLSSGQIKAEHTRVVLRHLFFWRCTPPPLFWSVALRPASRFSAELSFGW